MISDDTTDATPGSNGDAVPDPTTHQPSDAPDHASTNDPASLKPSRQAESAIRDELLMARKRPSGLSPHVMAQCPVMCDLLGNGDPEVASVELGHKLIEIIEDNDDVMALEAACYSLGLASHADTHLGRLQEFGDKHFLDQRQARRYSDRGIDQLARLISSHWTTQTVPKAEIIVIAAGDDQIAVMVRLERQWHIDMHPPELGVWQEDADGPTPLDVEWTEEAEQDEGAWLSTALTEPCIVPLTSETTVRLVWGGETWPTFVVALADTFPGRLVRLQTLGRSCAVGVEKVKEVNRSGEECLRE